MRPWQRASTIVQNIWTAWSMGKNGGKQKVRPNSQCKWPCMIFCGPWLVDGKYIWGTKYKTRFAFGKYHHVSLLYNRDRSMFIARQAYGQTVQSWLLISTLDPFQFQLANKSGWKRACTGQMLVLHGVLVSQFWYIWNSKTKSKMRLHVKIIFFY